MIDVYNPNLLANQAINELDTLERDMFIKVLHEDKKVAIAPFLFYTLGDNAFTFLDLFAGKTIKIPSQKELLRIYNHVLIYTYLKERDFTEVSISNACAIFKKKKPQVLNIVKHYNNLYDNLNSKIEEDVKK